MVCGPLSLVRGNAQEGHGDNGICNRNFDFGIVCSMLRRFCSPVEGCMN